ncbi:MAG: YARHG domain-containing protein, partial [Gammaproteobacteria bacterium]|nr:YARHG domain-containing protein [Gammaproteobacteria bacterium]
YYPADRNSVLYKVLKQAQILSSQVSFMGNDGAPYKQHDWSLSSDYANLHRGIDCSRAIWYAFTRAGLPYNRGNSYLPTAFMHQSDSQMRHYFESCSADNLQSGDVLVYRGPDKHGRKRQAGHTVMVLDPARELAWGSHGWDGSGKKDTGVEVQRVVPDGWGYWDRRNMVLKACWRYKDFSRRPGTYAPSPQPVFAKAAGMFPETALRRLTDADLEDKTKRMLRMMRNEMFARYGYRFRNTQLANYFGRQPWYRVSRGDSRFIYASLFSALERNNTGFIYQYEQDMSSGKQRRKPLPVNSTRRLTSADLQGKSKKALRLMRNEIFARRGFCFKPDGKLRQYFDRQSWYHCDTRDSATVYNQRFSQAERDNVNLIKRHE